MRDPFEFNLHKRCSSPWSCWRWEHSAYIACQWSLHRKSFSGRCHRCWSRMFRPTRRTPGFQSKQSPKNSLRQGRKSLEGVSTHSHRELRLAFVHFIEICVDEDDERSIEQRQNCSYHEELRPGWRVDGQEQGLVVHLPSADVLAKLERIIHNISAMERLIIAVHVKGDWEVATREEAPDGEDELENSHHSSRLLECIEAIACPAIEKRKFEWKCASIALVRDLLEEVQDDLQLLCWLSHYWACPYHLLTKSIDFKTGKLIFHDEKIFLDVAGKLDLSGITLTSLASNLV